MPYGIFDENSLSRNGDGATNMIGRVLANNMVHGVHLADHLIRESLIADLNQIYGQDAKFTGIESRRIDGGNTFEIYLREEFKGLVPLSQTGSGLKSVILVLLNLIIYPRLVFKRQLDQFIFAFEELENNLHPAVQRRLFLFLSSTVCPTSATGS